MELFREYIAGLNQAIAAGGDVCFASDFNETGSIIDPIEINEDEHCLEVNYTTNKRPEEQHKQLPASTSFTTHFDLPQELRGEGWK